MQTTIEEIKELYDNKLASDRANFQRRLDGLELEKTKVIEALATLEYDTQSMLYKGYLAEIARGQNGLSTMLTYEEFKNSLK